MHTAKTAFKRRSGQEWTAERIAQLSTEEVTHLRDNAAAMGETGVAALCDEALKARPRGGAKRAAPAAVKHGRRLISRAKALQARGVFLGEGAGGWSGLRKSDGTVVMCLWAGDVLSNGGGGCRQLLWAPNTDGARPWSETAAGKERRAHCKLAMEQGGAEGLLVYGERLDGHIAEDKARSVHGADPEVVVRFQVEQHGEEYWAVWGAKASGRPL